MTPRSLAVLLDTDVYSHIYVRRNAAADPRVAQWREQLRGRRVVIAFQTRAELLAGALQADWGTHRTGELRRGLDATPTISVDDEVVDAFAWLTSECRAQGHALHGKQHTGDRWIAACAIAKNVPLLSADRVFIGTPALETFN